MATRFEAASAPAYKWADASRAPQPNPHGKHRKIAKTPTQNPAERSSLSYMPALDGLRAVAVLAVLAYHADLPWARAGFLGVDVFFVISGYLITALLLSEHTRSGRINLKRFWGRRALRLLPGLLLMLAVVAVIVPVLAPDQNENLRGDLTAALTYVSNWWLIFQDQPYFEAIGRPPLLQHLWSLAVEEQFYLLWPVVLAFGLRNKSRNPRRLVKWVLLAVAGSATAMAVLYNPEGDTSRIYYGTDTRVGTILLGAALAFVWSPGHRTATPNWVGSFARDTAGLGSLLAIGWMVVTWNEFEPQLYRGGFTMVALLSVVVVGAASHPGGVTRALLGNLPMRWLGQRSYSIYLWHWPVFMLTRPELDTNLTGLPLLAVRIGLTLSLAVAGYGLVERPVRLGALSRAWDKVRTGLSSHKFGRATAGLASLSLLAVAGAAIGSGIVIPHQAPETPAEAALEHVSTSASASQPMEGVNLTQAPPPPAPGAAPPPPAPVQPPPPPLAGAPAGRVTAIGDSVMLYARDALIGRFGNAIVDAGIGRQTKGVIEAAQGLKERGELGESVIVHMGTNGVITVKQFDQLMELLKDVPRVLVVNVKVARPWESVNNQLLAENIGRYPNARLVDWKAAATAHPEVFYKDGVHLRPTGVGVYVDLLSGSVTG
ncbi:MAG TPA: acyltransferase family protein [Actinomycetota bacterium]|nr:acyltransferase family protein [Actinomycetota bacterium]